jgi:hypothetical protein
MTTAPTIVRGHFRHCPKHRRPLPCPWCVLASAPAPVPEVQETHVDTEDSAPKRRGPKPKSGVVMTPAERKAKQRKREHQQILSIESANIAKRIPKLETEAEKIRLEHFEKYKELYREAREIEASGKALTVDGRDILKARKKKDELLARQLDELTTKLIDPAFNESKGDRRWILQGNNERPIQLPKFDGTKINAEELQARIDKITDPEILARIEHLSLDEVEAILVCQERVGGGRENNLTIEPPNGGRRVKGEKADRPKRALWVGGVNIPKYKASRMLCPEHSPVGPDNTRIPMSIAQVDVKEAAYTLSCGCVRKLET